MLYRKTAEASGCVEIINCRHRLVDMESYVLPFIKKGAKTFLRFLCPGGSPFMVYKAGIGITLLSPFSLSRPVFRLPKDYNYKFPQVKRNC